MKTISIIVPLVLLAYVCFVQTSNLPAQTNDFGKFARQLDLTEAELLTVVTDAAARTNYVAHHNSDPELLRKAAQYIVSNESAKSNLFSRIHGGTEPEYKSNLISSMRQTQLRKPWPESSKRQAIFEHCAAVLRSAIDPNQIEIASRKMTNEVEALSLRNLSKKAMANLDVFASLLSRSDLNSYLGAGCRARLSTPENIFNFTFWPGSEAAGIIVRDLEKRTSDSKHVLVSARFSDHGKLIAFSVTEEMQLVFNEDGTVQSHWAASAKTKP